LHRFREIVPRQEEIPANPEHIYTTLRPEKLRASLESGARRCGMEERRSPVARLSDGSREHSEAAARILLEEEQYQEPLYWLSPQRRTQLEEELPAWFAEEYPRMLALHPDELYEEELREETEMAVRARLEKYLGMDSEAL
jgi:hypothetical protein